MALKTNVRQSSFDAYLDITPAITGKQCTAILRAMRFGRDYSLSELSEAAGIRISSVSGRVNELKKAGAVEEAPRRLCSLSGRFIIPVRITPVQLGLLA